MKHPILSVIVPVFNKEPYLPACLDSILNQTFRNFELILVNDGSTDASYQKCLEYAAKDDRIILIDQANAGVSAARNKGLNVANGRYIGFIDSDDTVETNMYEMLINNLEGNDADISICRLQVVFPHKKNAPDETSGSLIYNHHDAVGLFFKGRFDVSANNKIYKAALLRDIRFEGRIYEDILFTCKAFLAAETVVFENKVKYNYLVRDNSVSMTKFNRHYMETIHVSGIMVDLVRGEGENNLEHAKNFDVMANISLLNLLLLSGGAEYQTEYRCVVNNIKKYKPFIFSSTSIRRKHKYAVKAFLASPRLYRTLMYIYSLVTQSELIKRV